MGRGSIDESAVYVREVIRRAIELGSAALILVHNNPSGDPAPSRADIEITRNVIEAGKRMGIAVHDHLIIGRGGHASLRSMGLRSEEHTSELQSLMRISYAVFCLKKKNKET